AVAGLVTVLVRDDETPAGYPLDIDGTAVRAPPEGRPGSVMEEAAFEHLREGVEWLEVGVVAARLPRQRDVDGMVEVIAPLTVEAEAARLARRDELRVIEVGFGDERERAALRGTQGGNLDRHLLEHMDGTGVDERVDGIEPQPVDAVVAQPHE